MKTILSLAWIIFLGLGIASITFDPIKAITGLMLSLLCLTGLVVVEVFEQNITR